MCTLPLPLMLVFQSVMNGKAPFLASPQNYGAHNLESIKVAAAVRRSERSSGEDAPLALEIWKG